jgi:hypothetical protein
MCRCWSASPSRAFTSRARPRAPSTIAPCGLPRRDLLEPGRQIAAALAHLGQPHFFRPYNNLRFRPGPPLKENFAIAIGYGGGGGYYFDLSLDGVLVAAGIHHPASDQLGRFRAAIDNDRLARGFERAVRAAEAAGLATAPAELKRAPKGYAIDHPRIDGCG